MAKIKFIAVRSGTLLAPIDEDGENAIKSLSNAEIEVVNNVDNNEQDLMQDFVSLVTSFCARLYGRRRTRRLS